MDAAYLKSTVGDALAQGLAAIAINQPEDSVDYLGNFLLQYVQKQQFETKNNESREQALQDKAVSLKEDEIANKSDAIVSAKHSARRKEEEALAKLLDKTTEVEDLFGQVLSLVKKYTKASSAYLARREETQERLTQLQYISATPDNEWMVGNVLRHDQGVTWDAWKPVDNEGPPEFLSVVNVVRDDKVHFFRLPKLGAFLCVPISYNSCLHPDAALEGEEPSKTERPVSLALCLDTMGQGTRFNEEQASFACKWAAQLGRSLERAESAMWDSQVSRYIASQEGDTAFAALAAEEAQTTEKAVEEAMAAFEGSDDGRRAKEVEIRLDAARRSLLSLSLRDRFLEFTNLRVAPRGEVCLVLECVLLAVGVPRDALCAATATKLDWRRARLLFTSNTFRLLEGLDVTGKRKVESAAKVGVLLGRVDTLVPESLGGSGGGTAGALLAWLQPVLQARKLAVQARRASGETTADGAEE